MRKALVRSGRFISPGQHCPPKKAFIQKIATITKRSESAVRCWVAGVYQPDALAQEVIERELGIPASELFPKEDKVCAQ